MNNIPLKCWYALLIKLLSDILLNHNDFSIAPGGVPLSFAPASSEVVNPVGSLHHPGPLHHLEQAGGPGAPPVSTLSATYLNLNSHLLALDILRSLFCLSGRRRDGSPLPQLPTGWLYEHRQAPGDLCFLYSWRAGGECSNSIFRKWNLTRPLLSTLDRCHCGIKLNVDEVFFCRDRSFLGHIDEQESEDIHTTFKELLRWKGGVREGQWHHFYWTQRSIDLDDLFI